MEDSRLKQQAIFGVIWKFAERFCAQAVGFLVMVVLARLLVPADFGAIAVVLIFISFSNVFVDAGFNAGLIQKHDADELDYSTIFWFSTCVAIVLYGLLFTIAPYIAVVFHIPVLVEVLRVMGILGNLYCMARNSGREIELFLCRCLGGRIDGS